MLATGIAAIVGAVALRLAIYGEGGLAVISGGLVAAVAMFLSRLRARLVYGLLEVAFGAFELWNASGKGRGAFSPDFSDEFAKFQLGVVVAQTLAAIYVLIRGLDNAIRVRPSCAQWLTVGPVCKSGLTFFSRPKAAPFWGAPLGHVEKGSASGYGLPYTQS